MCCFLTSVFSFVARKWCSVHHLHLVFQCLSHRTHWGSHLQLGVLGQQRVLLANFILHQRLIFIFFSFRKRPRRTTTLPNVVIWVLCKLSSWQSYRKPQVAGLISSHWWEWWGGGPAMSGGGSLHFENRSLGRLTIVVEGLVAQFGVPWKVGTLGCL